jgi:molybdate transport system ATP-binding protein
MKLTLKNVRVALSDFELVVDVATDSRVTAIFGPSGAGKTSLLDVVAGVRGRCTGLVQLGDQVVMDSERGQFVPARERRIGYVPQDLALFPHLSVRQNLRYGMRSGENQDPLFSLQHVTTVLEIERLIEREVTGLSGGEKQRVALARALLSSPRLLLLDEPLASVDDGLKARIGAYLLRVRDEFPVTMLYVTHDREETRLMADDIVMLSSGKVTAAGRATEILAR